nr:14752_t:CDS:2 [Entrophospora candida]
MPTLSSGPFEPTTASLKHEEDDYKKLVLLSKDAYNYIRENYSSSMACIYELDLYVHPLCRWCLFDEIEYPINDLSSDSLFKTEICINYTSDEEDDLNLEDQELTDEESVNSSSGEESSGDSTDSSEELRKCKNGSLFLTINNN